MLSARLQLRQSQSLALTPQLLQSIRLLQYSHAELGAFLDAEIERNPLLERDADGIADAASGARRETEPAGDVASADAGTSQSSLDSSPRASTGAGSGTGRDRPLDSLAQPPSSLAEHVLAEIAQGCSDPPTRRIGVFLTDHLDEAGWLDCDLAAAAAALGVPLAAAETALLRIQDAVDPAGLFARGLADCLAIQLRRRDRLDPVMERVLGNLELLARRDFAALKRLTGEDEAGLLDILAEIRGLDPKPGHGFAAGEGTGVVPDILVSAAPDGGWRIELNPDVLPRVIVNETYAATLTPGFAGRGAAGGEGQAFVSECMASANWLVRSLDQRARTMLKVAAEIVRRQDAFLTRGVSGLRPMTLAAVAEAIGMHESTVSRVTANKYVGTPRGTFEMKFFFTVAIAATGGGEAHSAQSVKQRIRVMVDRETAGSVLSDDDIAEALRGEGVDLARRTVAKYREALGIASSIQRRRELNARRFAS